MRRIVLLLTVTLSLLELAQGQESFDNGYRGGKIEGLKTPTAALDFLVVGDWGRSGEYRQQYVARQMGMAAHQLNIDFIVSTGDNFYPRGVASIMDPNWQRSFEAIYTAHSLMTNWYPVLGNHDYAGNPQAEIEYSGISRRWNMPARYHSFTKVSGDGVKVLFVFMDTSPFEKQYYKDREEPFRSNVASQDTSAQKAWLMKTLNESDADWKIVFGHHPMHSAGPRNGRTGDIYASFKPSFEQGGVDLYVAGHEHSLQHAKLGDRLHQFISGAGSEVTPVKSDGVSSFAKSAHGFMTFSISKEGCLVQAIDYEGKIVYTSTLKK